MKTKSFRSIRIIIALVTFFTTLVIIPATVQTAFAFSTNSNNSYSIRSMDSCLALDNGGNSNTGTIALQWTPLNNGWQQWQINDVGGGYFEIVNRQSNLALDDTGFGGPGTKVQQWTRLGNDAQKWQINDVGNGFYNIINKANGMALDVIGWSKTPGGQVQTWYWSNTANQKWLITSGWTGRCSGGFAGRVSESQFNSFFPNRNGLYNYGGIVAGANQSYPMFASSGKVASVDNMSQANGAQVTQWDSNGSADHYWTFVDNGDGYFRLRSKNSGKVMAVSNMSQTDGASVTQWDDNGSADHLWRFIDNGDGYFRIQNKNSGKVMAVSNMSQANGAWVTQWSDNGSADHLWTLINNGDGYYILQNKNSTNSTIDGQEAAAFLANIAHETGDLVYAEEIDKSGNYCDTSKSYGCPAGTYAYYGRGPMQLSWNFNYKLAGDNFGVNLLSNPGLVSSDSVITWKTGFWYWMTQIGPGTWTGHDAMVGSHGFGETIRSINGAVECYGRNPAQVQDRINHYNSYTSAIGVNPGGNLSC